MARHLTLAQIEAQFRKWGVPYDVEPGAATRSNSNGWGTGADVGGTMYHHTGDDASDARTVALLRDGRVGLRGPLCNFAALDTGRIRIIAAGAANHAGGGDPETWALVKAGTMPYDREVRPNENSSSPRSVGGNSKMYGWESAYGSGTDLTPNPLQHRATLLSMAAIIDGLAIYGGLPRRTGRVMCGHREWTNRKPDPRAVDLGVGRSDISWLLAVGPAAAKHWYATGSKTLPKPPAPTTPTTPNAPQEADVFFVYIESTDKGVSAPVIASDGFTARWLNPSGWAGIKAGIAAATGRVPAAAPVKTLDGIAVEWVGPVPPQPAGKPAYPVPAAWLAP